MAVILGGVVLDGFEAPAGIRFGGCQRLAVHRLPGGSRIIDAMGPDESEISWRGFLSGNNAVARARQLDTMRQLADQVDLSWGSIFYTVVVSRIDFLYQSPWWIRCDIACTVVTNTWTQSSISSTADITSIVNDINSAGSWIDVSGADAALQTSNSSSIGTQANAAAILALGALSNQISGGITTADLQMSGNDLAVLTAAAGTLAELTAARGYVGRAAINLANIGA